MIPESTQWTVDKLVQYIKSKRVLKPQCQRKKKWQILNNGKSPNYQDYINFLYKTCHTIEVISMAKYIDENRNEIYMNIDGNNRINAIYYFYHHPLQINRENFITLRKNQSCPFVQFLENINYPDFMHIRRLGKYIIESKNSEIIELWESFSNDKKEEIENDLEIAQRGLKVIDNNDFHLAVQVNLIIFRDTSDIELSKIFESINKNNNPLEKSDILAATLITAKDFSLDHDKSFKIELLGELKKYYDVKNLDEILDCYSSTEDISYRMNGNEFLIAYHNYCSKKYLFLRDFDGKYFDLFHKLFETSLIFYEMKPTDFTTDNICNFVSKVNFSLDMINQTMDKIFPKTIDLSQFGNKYPLFSKNVMYILIVGTILVNSSLEGNKNKVSILGNLLKKILYFHFLIDSLPDEERPNFKQYDDLYFGGSAGSIVQQQVIRLFKEPTIFGVEVTKERMRLVLEKLVKKYNKPTTYERRKKTRRNFDYPYIFFYSIYYNNRVPIEFTKRKQNVDHIFPFSSKWSDGEIDLDRVGNLIIIDGILNNKRSNRSIEIYYEENPELMSCLNYPTIEKYNAVARHDKKGSEIINIEEFNNLSNYLENEYINCALKYIF